MALLPFLAVISQSEPVLEFWNILNKGGLIEGELNYIEIYLSYISKTIEKSFPNPHLIITEHPDKWLGTGFLQTVWTRPVPGGGPTIRQAPSGRSGIDNKNVWYRFLDVHAQLCPALPIFWNFNGSENELFEKFAILAEWNSDIPPPILIFRPNELFNLIDAISEMIQLSDIFVDACQNFPTILETIQGMFQFQSKFQSAVQINKS